MRRGCGEHLLGKDALRELLTAEEHDLPQKLAERAVALGLAGFVDRANRLFQKAWEMTPRDEASLLEITQGLEMLWAVSGTRPAYLPFAAPDLNELEQQHRSNRFRYGSCGTTYSQPWQELSGLFLYGWCCETAALVENPPLPDQDSWELQAFQGLERFLREPSHGCPGQATCLAAELSAKHGRKDAAIEHAITWARGYPDWHLNAFLSDMSRSRYIAPLLLTGILAEPLGMPEDRIDGLLQAYEQAVQDRLRYGKRFPFRHWTWLRLISRFSELALLLEPDKYDEDARRWKWLGFDPASDAEIEETEAHLGIRLPEDYREFLRTSSGFEATRWTWTRLAGANEIEWLRDADPQRYQWRRSLGPSPDGDDQAECIDRAILISDVENPTEMILLIAPTERHPSWQCWFDAPWMVFETRYESFREYFENEFDELLSETEFTE